MACLVQQIDTQFSSIRSTDRYLGEIESIQQKRRDGTHTKIEPPYIYTDNKNLDQRSKIWINVQQLNTINENLNNRSTRS